MKRTVLLLALGLAACGGDGSSVDPNLLAAAQCTSLGLEDLDLIFSEVTGLLASIGGTLPPNVTYTAPDYTITMSLGTVAGSVTSTDNISDGIDAGEAASASWNLTPLAGAGVAGNGTFNLSRLTDVAFTITGDGSVVDGACVFNATNLDLDLDLSSGLGPVGSFDFNGVTPTGPILGTMTFDGSSTAVVEAIFLGVSATFTINLDTFDVSF